MNQIRHFPTDFSKYLFLYSNLGKSVNDLFNSHPDIFLDIARSFCVRTKIVLVKSTLGPLQHPVVVVRTAPEQETLDLYFLWNSAWKNHGFAAPFLDIQYV